MALGDRESARWTQGVTRLQPQLTVKEGQQFVPGTRHTERRGQRFRGASETRMREKHAQHSMMNTRPNTMDEGGGKGAHQWC